MYDCDNIIKLINDNLDNESIKGRSKFFNNQSKSYMIFFHNKILISMARLASTIRNIHIPFIDNYKIFLDDDLQYDNEVLPVDFIFKYINICLSSQPIDNNAIVYINSKSDFSDFLRKYSINTNNTFSTYIRNIRRIEIHFIFKETDISQKYTEYIKSIYALYGIIVSEYLNVKKYDLTGESPFTTEINKDLNKINIYTPLEERITLHYFCIAYLRTKEQRNHDYPAIFDSAYTTISDSDSSPQEKTYTYKEIIDTLFKDANPIENNSDNSANNLSNNIKKILTEMYKTVNLKFNPSKCNGTVHLKHVDFSILVLWYMLFRHHKSFDQYICKFDKIIESNVNIRKFFTTLNLESLNDYDTLCIDRKGTNVGAVVNTFLMNAVSDDFEEIDCTTSWYKILNSCQYKLSSPPLHKQLMFVYQKVYQDYNPLNVLDEYKYLARFYNFVTGIDAMKTILSSICADFDKFKNITLPIPDVDNPTIDDFFQKEFIDNELYVVSPLTEKKNQVQSIKDKMETTKRAYRIINQQEKYSVQNISALIWLHHNGKLLRVKYPAGYNSPEPFANVETILKSDQLNSRFHQFLITHYVSVVTGATKNFECTKKKYEILLSMHTELMKFINSFDNQKNTKTQYTPHQKIRILCECLSKVADDYYS